jgi:hypothetical protein
MQLGTRWTSGEEPPRSVPAALHAAITEVEASTPPVDPPSRWTLTWLEGRPVAELDSGETVSVDRSGAVVVGHSDDDDA